MQLSHLDRMDCMDLIGHGLGRGRVHELRTVNPKAPIFLELVVLDAPVPDGNKKF